MRYLECLAATRREDLEEADERQRARHEEVQGMMLALGQSMAGVAGALPAHTQSTTVAAARHTEGLVNLTQENVALREAVTAPTVSPEVRRAEKRPRTVGEQLTAEAVAGDGQALASGVEPVLRQDIIYSTIMEPELMTGKMKTQSLLEQLQWMVHQAHVSTGVPWLFGSFVIKNLYDQAGRAAVADAGSGGNAPKPNREKKERLANLINNKADTYVRQLFWLHMIVPKVKAMPAARATVEEVKTIKFEKDDREAVMTAIRQTGWPAGGV